MNKKKSLTVLLLILLFSIIVFFGTYFLVRTQIWSNITVDEKENVYLALDNEVYKFDGEGNLLFKVRKGLGYFLGLAVDKDENIYITDNTHYQLKKYNKNGKLVLTIPLTKKRPRFGQWREGFNVEVDREENIWVVFSTKNKIVKYSPEGKLLLTLGEEGDIKFTYPNDITFDKEENIYIADTRDYSVDILDKNLNFFKSLPASRTQDFSLFGTAYHCPLSIALDSQDNIYLANFDDYYDEGVINKINQNGEFLAEFTWKNKEGNSISPSSIFINEDLIYVIDGQNYFFYQIDTSGEIVSIKENTDLDRILARKRALTRFHSKSHYFPLGVGILVLLFILGLKIAENLPNIIKKKEIARDFQLKEGYYSYPSFLGISYCSWKWITFWSIVIILFSGILKDILFGFFSGGFYYMSAKLSISDILELTAPFLISILILILFLKLKFPSLLKILGISIFLLSLTRILDEIPFIKFKGIMWHIVSDISFEADIYIPLIAFTTLILFIISHWRQLIYRKYQFNLNEAGIYFFYKNKERNIKWEDIKKIIELRFPYRTTFFFSSGKKLAIDSHIKNYAEIKEKIKTFYDKISQRRNISFPIVNICIAILILSLPSIPRIIYKIIYEEPIIPRRVVKQFSLNVNTPKDFQTDEDSYKISGSLTGAKGEGKIKVTINGNVVKPDLKKSQDYYYFNFIIPFEEGVNKIKVEASDDSGKRLVKEGSIIFNRNINYQRDEIIYSLKPVKLLVYDLNKNGTEELIIVDKRGFISILEWDGYIYKFKWQSINLEPTENPYSYAAMYLETGYLPDYPEMGIWGGYESKGWLLGWDGKNYLFKKFKDKLTVLQPIPDTNNNGKTEFIRKKDKGGKQLLERKEDTLVPILEIPREFSDIMVEDLNQNGIPEIYSFHYFSFVGGLEGITIMEWQNGAHNPLRPNNPVKEIITRIRNRPEFLFSISFDVSSNNAVSGDFDGDKHKELFVLKALHDYKDYLILEWIDNKLEVKAKGKLNTYCYGPLLKGDLDKDGKDEIVEKSGTIIEWDSNKKKFDTSSTLQDKFFSISFEENVYMADTDRNGISEIIILGTTERKGEENILIFEYEDNEFKEKWRLSEWSSEITE